MFFRLVFLVFLINRISALTASEWDTIWGQAEKKCENLMKFSSGDRKTLLTKIEDIPKRAKCFVSCFFDEVGLTNGIEINHELYTSWLEEELQHTNTKNEIIKSVKNCTESITGTDKCETAYQLYECFGQKYFS